MNNQGGMGGYGSGGGAPGQPPAHPQYPATGQQPQYYPGYGGPGGVPGVQSGAHAAVPQPGPMGYANSPQTQYGTRPAPGTAAQPQQPPGGAYGGYYGGPATGAGGPQAYMQHSGAQSQPQPQQPNMYGMPQMSSTAPGMYGGGGAPTASNAPPPNTNFGMTPSSYSSSTSISSAAAAAPAPFGAMGSGSVASTMSSQSGQQQQQQQPQLPFGAAPSVSGGMMPQTHHQPMPTAPAAVAHHHQQVLPPTAVAAPVAASAATSSAHQLQTLPLQQQQSSSVATKIQHPYEPEVLEHLEKYSVPDLCAIGRELIADLNYRTSMLCTTFKAVSDRKPYTFSPESQLEYCQMLLKKIVEIRLRIEKNMPKKRLTADDFIEMLREPGEPEVSARVREQEEIFTSNREKLINLSSDLKMLDWLAQVADPSHLKRTDGISSRKEATKPGVI